MAARRPHTGYRPPKGDDERFKAWLEQQSASTRITIVVVILLAVVGLYTIMDRLASCRVAQGCDPHAEYYSDPW